MTQNFGPGAIRHYLRTQTVELHEQLDSDFAALDLTARGDYGRFLQIQAEVLIPLEAYLEANEISGLLPDWPERKRAGALASDMAALGIEAAPVALKLPAADRPFLFGIAYVLEGSRLGAQFLLRTVGQSSDPAVRGNVGFLSHGRGLRLWPTFLAALENEVTEATRHGAAEGARTTFGLFLDAQKRSLAVVAGA